MTQTVETVVTYLEMTARPTSPPPPRPMLPGLFLVRVSELTVEFYRYLYDAVGRDYHWVDRKKLSDSELEAQIHKDGVDVWVAYVGGAPAGFFELDGSREETVTLAYFGLLPHAIGRGLSRWLLREALEAAWDRGPNRVTVETCTLDHPRAFELYQAAGFRPYERFRKTMRLPD